MKRPAAALAPEAELGTGGDNDKTGKLVRSDTSSWRWQVELEEGLGTKGLKSANLTIAEAELRDRCEKVGRVYGSGVMESFHDTIKDALPRNIRNMQPSTAMGGENLPPPGSSSSTAMRGVTADE